MGACARRIAAASTDIKAYSLDAGRVEHAAWRMPSPRALELGINHLELNIEDTGEYEAAEHVDVTATLHGRSVARRSTA